MKNLNGISYKEINGQNLYFLNDDEWQKILEEQKLGNIALIDFIVKRLISLELPLFNKYPDLHLVGSINKSSDGDLFNHYVLIDFDGEYQRVDIRKVCCNNCLWKGVIGNPNVSDIYFGISTNKKPFELMREARRFETKKCPKCDTEFNQPAIWIGDLPDNLKKAASTVAK